MTGKKGGLADRFDRRLARVVETTRDLEQTRSQTRLIHVDQLAPSTQQGRLDFTDVPKLGRSVLARGVLMPIRVRELGEDRYEIIAGEQRWRASKWAAQQNEDRAWIPCVVTTSDDEASRQDGLHENLFRTNLNEYELTRIVLSLLSEQLDQEQDSIPAALRRAERSPGPEADLVRSAFDQVCAYAGLDLSLSTFVRFYLPLLSLPDDLREAMEQQGLSYLVALELRRVKDAPQRTMLLKQVLAGECGLTDVRALLNATQPPAEASPPERLRLQKLSRSLSGEWVSRLPQADRDELAGMLTALESWLSSHRS